jgi:hypothetical protein
MQCVSNTTAYSRRHDKHSLYTDFEQIDNNSLEQAAGRLMLIVEEVEMVIGALVSSSVGAGVGISKTSKVPAVGGIAPSTPKLMQ